MMQQLCNRFALGLRLSVWLWPFVLTLGLSARAATGTGPARAFGLDRRARNRAIGAEHATVAGLRPQHGAAAAAAIENLAGVDWHLLPLCGSAMRASDHGFNNHGLSPLLPHAQIRAAAQLFGADGYPAFVVALTRAFTPALLSS